MPQDITQQQDQQTPVLDQDTSRAALATITYLMTHLLPKAQMQSQAQLNPQVQQQEQQAEQKQPSQPEQPDKTAELKGQMDAMKTEGDAKIKSLVENQQKEIDQLKQMIQQVLSEDQNEPQQTLQTPSNP